MFLEEKGQSSGTDFQFLNEVILNSVLYSNIFHKFSLMLMSITITPSSNIEELLKRGFDKFEFSELFKEQLVEKFIKL